MRVAIYVRVSTDDQAKGTSLNTQEERCRAHAGTNGWEVVDCIRDNGVSGAIAPADRRGFGRIMALDIDLVLAADQDRVSRDAEHWLGTARILRERGISIRTLDGADTSSESGLLDTIRAAIAEEERRKIAQRTRQGRFAKARDGSFSYGQPPYGFVRVPKAHPRDPSVVVLQPDEVEVILRAVALLVDERRSPHEVATILNVEGFQTRGSLRGTPPTDWTSDALKAVLKRKALTGRHVFGTSEGEVVVTTDPILTCERWQTVQDALRIARVAPYRPTHVYPLSGILTSPCGRFYSGQYCNERRYYRCRGRDRAPRCTCRMLWASVVEEIAFTGLMEALQDPDTLLAALDPTHATVDGEDHEARLHALRSEILRIEDALTMTAVRLAHLPPRVIQDATRELEAQHVLASDRLTRAERFARDEVTRERQRSAILALCDRASRQMRAMTEVGMHRLFQSNAAGITKVVVTSETPVGLEIEIRGLDPISALSEDGAVVTAASRPSDVFLLDLDLVAV